MRIIRQCDTIITSLVRHFYNICDITRHTGEDDTIYIADLSLLNSIMRHSDEEKIMSHIVIMPAMRSDKSGW